MSAPQIKPYLFFGGRCQEALDYYRSALGAEILFVMRYDEAPDPLPPGQLPPGFETKVMHATFRIGGSVLMASDGSGEPLAFNGFVLSLSFDDEAAVDRTFKALAEGGTIGMPLAKTFWSPRFGMVTDRFGVGWMVTKAGPPMPPSAT